MYVKTPGDDLSFDAIIAVEGQFKFRPDLDAVPVVEVLMAYANSTTKTTYGTCPFKSFSPRTTEALIEFLRCAEQDFGDIVFKGGIVAPFGPLASTANAESEKALPRGLGEEAPEWQR